MNTPTIEYALDSYGDGQINHIDNCTIVPNPAQRETDSNSYGNYRDPGFDNSLIVNAGDTGYLKSFLLAN